MKPKPHHSQLAAVAACVLLLAGCGGGGGGSASTGSPPVAGIPSSGSDHVLPTGFWEGSSTLDIVLATPDDLPVPRITGSFRTVCSPTHMSYDDPIVFPDEPGAAHLHTFFGNAGANAYSTTDSLLNTGNSSCRGGILNRSAYWVPSMIDTRTNTAVMPRHDSDFYYKTGFDGVSPGEVKPFPIGLRMIAGDARNTSPNSDSRVGFECHSNPEMRGSEIQNCAVGDQLVQVIFFPQCWDDEHLDSRDHKSHMAYPDVGVGCPSTHPPCATS